MAQGGARCELTAKAEHEALQSFCFANAYPSMEECVDILASEVDLLSEYGELAHDSLKEIYESGFQDERLIAIGGRAIRTL
eukprot:9140853-Karenia_brevis.AAC.1